MSWKLSIFGKDVIDFRSESLENPANSLSDPSVIEALTGGMKANTGATVNPNTALAVSAVYRAVALLSGTMAALPLHVYQREDQGNRNMALQHPAYNLLHNEPNSMQTSFYFRETAMTHLLLTSGNFFAYILRGTNYQPDSIYLLEPEKVRVVMVDYQLWYFVEGVKEPIPARDMIHVAGLGFDGIKGKTPLRIAREAIGQGLTLQDFASYFFANGANVSAVIEHPAKMNDQQYTRFRESWERAYQGVQKSNRTAILEGGAKLNKLSIPPEEAQFLQTRKFNVTEIARIFGVAPHKLYDLERSTNNNIEHQGIEFVQDTISILAARIEAEFNRKLFRENEKGRFYTKFNLNALMRGDVATRAGYYSLMRNITAMTADEIRQLEDMNPRGGEADELLFPLNMATETQLKQQNKQDDGKSKKED